RSAVEPIALSAADEGVVAVPGVEGVVPVPAVQKCGMRQRTVGMDQIIAGVAEDGVAGRVADEFVVSASAVDRAGADQKNVIVSAARIDRNCSAGGDGQIIIAVAAVDRVIA